LEAEILTEVLEVAAVLKKHLLRSLPWPKGVAMSAVCNTLQVARSNVAEQPAGRPAKRRVRPALPDEDPMITAVEHRFRPVNRLPQTIE
jgi:hypothetical protein